MHDIIIIGAGPAGLTAVIYARLSMKNVLVLESKTYGGQIINAIDIENYPAAPHISGFDFAMNLYNQVKDLGTEFIYEEVIRINDKEKKQCNLLHCFFLYIFEESWLYLSEPPPLLER